MDKEKKKGGDEELQDRQWPKECSRTPKTVISFAKTEEKILGAVTVTEYGRRIKIKGSNPWWGQLKGSKGGSSHNYGVGNRNP